MGHFLTGVLLMTGAALPLLLAHTGIITTTAAVLSLSGGLIVYGTSTPRTLTTVMTDAAFFHTPDDL